MYVAACEPCKRSDSEQERMSGSIECRRHRKQGGSGASWRAGHGSDGDGCQRFN